MSNYQCELEVDVNRRQREFQLGDSHGLPLPISFSKRKFQNLYARFVGPFVIVRRIRSNACFLDLPTNLTISPIFNVIHLYPYLGTFEPHAFPFDVCADTFVVPAPHISHNTRIMRRLHMSLRINMSSFPLMVFVIFFFIGNIIFTLVILGLEKMNYTALLLPRWNNMTSITN